MDHEPPPVSLAEPVSDALAEPIISTAELTKAYGAVTALDHLTLTIGTGVTGLVGANGAGKSTLIKLLLGLIQPTSGAARVLGFDVAQQAAQLRALVGYQPEHDCLPPDATASDFVVHMAKMSGLPHVAARERAAEVLRHVGLADERYRRMGGYSTGMKQRVKLAQAIVHDPRLVFLDEPTNGLDPAARDEMLELIRRIGSDFGITVVVTSHLLGELERVSDNIVILDAGRLLKAEAISTATAQTGSILIEVMRPDGADAQDEMGQALRLAGALCGPAGSLIELPPPAPEHRNALLDLIRDTAASRGIGIVRISHGRRRIEDVFAETPGSRHE